MLKKLLIIIALLLNFSIMADDVKLTPDNFIHLSGEVSGESVAKLSNQLLLLSAKLPLDEPIYLIIDSGGGSVYAGLDFINVMKAVPQKIISVSTFAFSMAYTISQRADTRLINLNGIMGQHRAKGSFAGQFGDGEVEKQLALWKSIVYSSNQFEADKMGITLEEFQALIKDEMYVYDKEAVEKKVADGVAYIKCSKELITKYRYEEVQDFFGRKFRTTFSSCPLIRTPIKVEQIQEKKVEDGK